MSLGPSLGRFQFLPRPKIVAGLMPLACKAGEEEEEGHTTRLLGIPDSVPAPENRGRGWVPSGVDGKLVKQEHDKSLASSGVFVFLFS